MTIQAKSLKPAFRVKALAKKNTGIEIQWDDQHTSFYHNLWLRDSCRCSKCFQPDTLSINTGHDPLKMSLDPIPENVQITTKGELEIQWGGAEIDHQSVYDASWLRVHCHTDPQRKKTPDKQHWDGSLEIPHFNYDAIMMDRAVLLTWLQQIITLGVALVDNAPKDQQGFRALIERIGPLQQRYHPDDIFTLDTKNQAFAKVHHAYQYAGDLRNHTDHVSYNISPRLQFFGCTRYENAEKEGEAYSTLVDGFKIAEVMREKYPEYYELLTTEYVSTGRRRLVVEEELDKKEKASKMYEWDIHHRHHVIEEDEEGQVCQIRYHHNDRVPLDIPHHKLKTFMAAYRQFSNFVDSGEYNVKFLIEPGQILVNDNWRILHGRTGISSPSLHRTLLGAYMKSETFRSRYRILLGKQSHLSDLWLMGCSDSSLERLAQRTQIDGVM